MTKYASDIAFSPTVKEIQERLGSRENYAKMERGSGFGKNIPTELAAFIAERDSLYLATVNADGQPYIQHRGGPKGFLKPLDEATLAFADFAGNRQYVSMGNLVDNDKACIFLMSYSDRQRIKIWGRARFVEDDRELLERLTVPSYKGTAERALVFHVEAWDRNCPQHITPRFSAEEIAPELSRLNARIAELEAEVAARRGG